MAPVSQPSRPAAAFVARAPAARAAAARTAAVAITFAPNPPQAGSAEQIVVSVSRAGKPVVGAHITATVTMVSMDMGALHPAFKPAAPGVYRAAVMFTMGGTWKLVVISKLPKVAKAVTTTETVSVGA